MRVSVRQSAEDLVSLKFDGSELEVNVMDQRQKLMSV